MKRFSSVRALHTALTSAMQAAAADAHAALFDMLDVEITRILAEHHIPPNVVSRGVKGDKITISVQQLTPAQRDVVWRAVQQLKDKLQISDDAITLH